MTAPYIPPRPRTLEEALRAAFMPPVQADATATPPVRPDFSGVPMATMRATSAPMPRGPRETGNHAADRLNARVDRGLAMLGRQAAPSADTPEGWLREMFNPVAAGRGTREMANATGAQMRRAGRTGNVGDAAMAAGLGGLTLASAIPGGPADDAARAAKMIDVDGVMRPRFNARGQLIHPTEDGIRNFWRWFGESKTVDSEGLPLVKYHGTTSRDAINSFDKAKIGSSNDRGFLGEAFYFGDDASADAYAGVNNVYPERSLVGGSVYPVYLKSDNPLIARGDYQAASEMLGIPRTRGRLDTNAKQITDEAQRRGFTGIDYARGDYDDAYGEMTVFDPTQIKSAIGNSGAFSRTDPRITAAILAAFGIGNASRPQERP